MPGKFVESAWETAARALTLRGWALRLLAGGGAAPPDAPPAAWDAFLRAERCALAVRARAAGTLPAHARDLVERRATAELQRFLSVRAQVRQLGALLRERGWPGVVLKGTAHAAEGGEPLDVADVDVLLHREHAAAFAELMEARGGYQAIGGIDHGGELGTGWQLAMRLAEGGVQVEVHFDVPFTRGVDAWDGVVETPARGILRLSPANHLWHVLVHGAVHHLERRGSIRELLLLKSARAACGPGDLRVVAERAAAHPDARALARVLAMLDELAGRAAPSDGFREAAALRYALAAGAGWGSGRRGMSSVTAAFALLEGGGSYRSLWMGNPASALVGPGFRGTTRWDRFAGAAWMLRSAWRGAHLAAATLPAWRAARGARKVAAAA